MYMFYLSCVSVKKFFAKKIIGISIAAVSTILLMIILRKKSQILEENSISDKDVELVIGPALDSILIDNNTQTQLNNSLDFAKLNNVKINEKKLLHNYKKLLPLVLLISTSTVGYSLSSFFISSSIMSFIPEETIEYKEIISVGSKENDINTSSSKTILVNEKNSRNNEENILVNEEIIYSASEEEIHDNVNNLSNISEGILEEKFLEFLKNSTLEETLKVSSYLMDRKSQFSNQNINNSYKGLKNKSLFNRIEKIINNNEENLLQNYELLNTYDNDFQFTYSQYLTLEEIVGNNEIFIEKELIRLHSIKEIQATIINEDSINIVEIKTEMNQNNISISIVILIFIGFLIIILVRKLGPQEIEEVLQTRKKLKEKFEIEKIRSTEQRMELESKIKRLEEKIKNMQKEDNVLLQKIPGEQRLEDKEEKQVKKELRKIEIKVLEQKKTLEEIKGDELRLISEFELKKIEMEMNILEKLVQLKHFNIIKILRKEVKVDQIRGLKVILEEAKIIFIDLQEKIKNLRENKDQEQKQLEKIQILEATKRAKLNKINKNKKIASKLSN